MAKKRIGRIKLQLKGGEVPQSIIAPIFGSKGLSQHMMAFGKDFCEKTKDERGRLLSVTVCYYDDKTIDYVIKKETVVSALKRAATIVKGSGVPNQNKVGEISSDALKKIAEEKISDLNAYDVEAAKKIIAGTARSIGLKIV
ncbi:MAG: 50S ribosomal protein L11 [Cytophagales bacterium]|nr:50S ribosomal protein L11 [Cytophagales bacterium]